MFEAIAQYTLLDWFQLVGAVVAFILAILKGWEFWKNRVRLDISLKQKRFKSQTIKDHDSYDITEIEIDVDLKNKGLEPTSISSVEFHSSIKGLHKIEMCNVVHYFEKIRVDSNDRTEFVLYLKKNILLSDTIKSLDATLIFKTTHKDISQHIILKREKN